MRALQMQEHSLVAGANDNHSWILPMDGDFYSGFGESGVGAEFGGAPYDYHNLVTQIFDDGSTLTYNEVTGDAYSYTNTPINWD